MAALVTEVRGAEAVAAAAGRPPGTLVHRPDLAATLAVIGDQGRDAFYGGGFGRALLALGDGLYEPDDLAEPGARWVEPLGTDVWGQRLWTVPAPSQGYLALLGARIAERFGLPDDARGGSWAHATVEAARAAGHDRPSTLHDRADLAALLTDDEVRRRTDLLDPDVATDLPTPALPGDTIYL
ncbi:hypothetical protein B7486_76295, partial [cyanobacterium TDX16]